jgi:hypothetical protein
VVGLRIPSIVLAVVLGLLPSPIVLADQDVAADWFRDLAKRLVIEDAAFTQTRHMSILSNPLQSSGIAYRNDDGELIWHQTMPYDVVLRITPDFVEETVSGLPSRIVAGEDDLFMGTMALSFSGLFSGRPDLLLSMFDVREEVLPNRAEGAWKAILVPKSQLLAKAIDRFEAEGTVRIERVRIYEVSGDFTEISLVPRAALK